MGIEISRTSVAVGGLLAVLDAMPWEVFVHVRDVSLASEAPAIRALGELMRAFESDALEGLANP